MGGKHKLAKRIVPIMESFRDGRAWVEPFVGACNVIALASGERIGNDANKYVVSMFAATQRGWTPPSSVSRELYADIRANADEYPPELVGFVGVACSFSGKWWGGYASDKAGRNYAKNGANSLMKLAPLINGVRFTSVDYREMKIEGNSLVYCDPPYGGTTSYGAVGGFDSGEFWGWCRAIAAKGCMVFVSEYRAPEDFKEIFSASQLTTVKIGVGQPVTEKLFAHESTLCQNAQVRAPIDVLSQVIAEPEQMELW